MTHRIIQEDIARLANDIRHDAKKLSGKTLLITGGAGFLGRYFLLTFDYLNKNILEKPCKIILVDNFVTGLKDFGIDENNNFELIVHDVRTPLDIGEKIDFIIHAAGIGSPVIYNKYKIETLEVGVLGTRNMLELARKKNVESFLFFSSSEVYGDPDPKFVPTPETYFGNVSTIGPRALYDESKRVGETFCVVYNQVYGVPTKMVRPFNVYGPGMRHDDFRVIPNFVSKALKGEELPVYGDGSNTRTFCYISDAITGFFKVLLSDFNDVFNVGNQNNEISMFDLAKIINEFQKDIRINRVIGPNETYKSADPKRRCPDLTKIKTMLGYDAKVDLRTGLQRFMEWAKDVYPT